MKRVYHNPVTRADPLRVAQLFAVQNFTDKLELDFAERIICLVRDKRFSEVKPLLDEFARPDSMGGFPYYLRKQFCAFISKVPFKGNHKGRLANAKSSFWKAERKCKRTNRRLKWYFSHVNRINDDTRVILSRAKEIVRKVLGELTEKKLDEIIQLSYPGRGVSVGTRNRFRVSLPYKLGDTDLCCTRDALPYASRLVEGSTAWLRLHMELDFAAQEFHVPYVLAEGNKISFVEKDMRTLRTIAIEPALNVALQLGVHSYMAERLQHFGNPIDDQSINQDLAEVASLLPLGVSYATIDLSQASDSVSTELVRWLLPPAWFGLLDDLRSKTGTLDGNSFEFEKFSSMGNGFTFALETLIFMSLARAVNSLIDGKVASVYGDDIIIDDRGALLLTEVLEFVGFSVNREKTFYIGPFRESCGADWHNGSRVTPQYIRKPELRPTDLYAVLNRIDPLFNFKEARKYIIEEISRCDTVLYGLENEDTSSCLFVPFSIAKEKRVLRWSPYYQTWTFLGWSFKPAQDRPQPLAALAAALFGGSRSRGVASLRGRGTFRLSPFTPGVTRDLPSWQVG